MAGMNQQYTCSNCHYKGSADVPANAAPDVAYQAAEADHSERSPECDTPELQLGDSSPDAA